MEQDDGVITIPLGLQQALESEECVLFVGAGIGKYVKGPDGHAGPDGTTLAKELAERFGIETGGSVDLSKIAEVVEIRRGRTELETFVKARLAGLEPAALVVLAKMEGHFYYKLRFRG